MKILVVLPTYNESENIERVLCRIRKALADATVLVVDDGSPDGTAEIVDSLGRELGNIQVLHRHEKSGLGSAYRAGFRWGLGNAFDAFVEIDADLSHEPEALPGLVARLVEETKSLSGRGTCVGVPSPIGRGIGDCSPAVANVYASVLLGLGVSDSTSGFRAYSATVLERMDLDRVKAEGYGFQIEMTYQAVRKGASVVEIPIRFVDRVDGQSKMSIDIVAEALVLVTWSGVQRSARNLRQATTARTRSKSAG